MVVYNLCCGCKRGINVRVEVHFTFGSIPSLSRTLFVLCVILEHDRNLVSCYRCYIPVVQTQTVEDTQDESGWKLVHGDVFRPPSFSPMLLSVLCGSGMQVLAMTLSTITFAFMGFLSPANRYCKRTWYHVRMRLWNFRVVTRPS